MATPHTAVQIPATRYPGLDGLRGLAAMSVMFSHMLIAAPSLQHLMVPGAREIPTSSWQYWFTYSPLHFWWLGTEAVYLFFILSGFVLALPWTRNPSAADSGAMWRGYYPSRLARLYLPIWASLIVAWLWMQAITGEPDLPAGVPFDTDDHTLRAILSDGVTLFGTGSLNLPLWSLQWELWFSLLLPIYLIVARQIRTPAWTATAFALTFAVIGAGIVSGHSSVSFLSMFLVGVILAYRRDDVHQACTWLRCRVPAAMAWLLAAGIVLSTAHWVILGVSQLHSRPATVGVFASVVGIALIIVAAIEWPPLTGALSTRPVQFLGARSFSLYLVHSPVLMAVLAGLGTDQLWLLFPVSLLTVLVVTELFYRVIEQPAHRTARTIRRRCSGTADTTPTAPDIR